MYKLLNLTRNEMIDVEEDIEYKPVRERLFQSDKSITYTLSKPRPLHWQDGDKYKVIEI